MADDDNLPSSFYINTMFIESLKIKDFRNISTLETEFGVGLNIICGDNGSGKTNLLEALFVLSLGRSQKGAPDSVLLKNETDVYRLEGVTKSDNANRVVAVAYGREGRKKLTIDSAPGKASDLYRYHCVVSSGPEDSEILSGPPSARRLFLDIYLSQISQAYLYDLSCYLKAISQKNAALKQEYDPSLFDSLIVEHGSKIIKARKAFLTDLAPHALERYKVVAGGEEFTVLYQPQINSVMECETFEEIKDSFTRAIEHSTDRERALRTALVGPHRDNILFNIGSLPARTHGSQGQWRTAAIALKLAVYELLTWNRTTPILLLDEIFAELDESRSKELVKLFEQAGQVFVTTANRLPSYLLESGRRYKISRGKLIGVSQ